MTIKVIKYANLKCKPKYPNGLVLSQHVVIWIVRNWLSAHLICGCYENL